MTTEANFDINQFLNDAMKPHPVEPNEDEFVRLCQQFQRHYSTLPNLLSITQPMTIVGSVHAQLDDIHELFDVCGAVPYTSYLFLGDFVNYGDRNIATVCLLFSLALKYPDHVYLLRGAHESRRLTLVCGLYEEIINAYGSPRAWEALMDAFDSLPLAAQVCYQFFCLSGGIDKSIVKLNQINEFNRFVEVPLADSWSSLVWSIPKEGYTNFTPIENHHGYFFGEPQIDKFLKDNGLSCIIRSKQLCMNGHTNLFNGKCITVWSAPNFCGWIQNAASVVQMHAQTSQFGQKGGSAQTYTINTFKARPESERIEQNRPPFQDVHSLDHIYIKHLPKLP
ncbi:Serine/threonine-protein phosphatase PP2A-like PPG1 [Histomonas meleagridis]|uniref:Serine/threonine-protein phosphatase PP2A-like PPG1 n=1 Tax=Histomonas meleagridis TaxID=135588 RepID=UPI003559D6BE|nr:Serine/threonine-protein phosphatase PP2A-like PPG1 [Histomonas meleagridis]KAH0805617.1 Serine/threonine-protein phosphatase PP2A-like PPG1 [Histomonas meleagridis]